MEPQTPDRLTFRNIIQNFFRDLTNADRGMWGTIVQLTIRPQWVIDTFLFKDRKQFIRPTRYVLFALSVAALSFVVIQWRYGEPVEEYLRPTYEREANKSADKLREGFDKGIANLTDEAAIERRRAENEKAVKTLRDANISLTENMIKYGNYIGIVFLPLSALLYWLMFPRKQFNYAEHLASVGYINSHASLLGVLLLPFLLFANSPEGLIKALMVSSVLTLGYQLYATFRVYVTSWKDILISSGIFIAFGIGFVILIQSSSYSIGYVASSMVKEACDTCSVNYWKVAKFLPALLFFTMLIMIRVRPKRWLIWTGIGLVALVAYFLW